jgi:uncharacterized protein
MVATGSSYCKLLELFFYGLNLKTFKPDILTGALMFIVKTFFEGKSWTLLALLFGYGFVSLTDNLKKKGHQPFSFFAGRMFYLFILGLINSAIYFGDILKDYAFLGLLMLLLYKFSAKTVLIISILLLLALPLADAYISSLNKTGSSFKSLIPLYLSKNLGDVLWFGLKAAYNMISRKLYFYLIHLIMMICLLWGFFLYKIDFFSNQGIKLKYVKRSLWINLTVSIFLTVLFKLITKYGWGFLKYYPLNYWMMLSSMLTVASAICWLFFAGILKYFFANMSIIGKMTLTNYIIQNLRGMLVFSGFGFKVYNTMAFSFYVLLAIVVFICQVYFSKWWLAKYYHGPIEWIWRQLSYRRKLPLKK